MGVTTCLDIAPAKPLDKQVCHIATGAERKPNRQPPERPRVCSLAKKLPRTACPQAVRTTQMPRHPGAPDNSHDLHAALPCGRYAPVHLHGHQRSCSDGERPLVARAPASGSQHASGQLIAPRPLCPSSLGSVICTHRQGGCITFRHAATTNPSATDAHQIDAHQPITSIS